MQSLQSIMLSAQHLKRAIPDQFKPVPKIWNCSFGNITTHDIEDELFHTYGHTNATDISKIDETIKTLWDPTKPIEMHLEQIMDAQIFDPCKHIPTMAHHVCIGKHHKYRFFNELCDFHHQHNTHNIDWSKLKNLGHCMDRTRTLPAFFGKYNLCHHYNRWCLHIHLQHSCGQPCCSTCPWQCYIEPILGDWSNHAKGYECHHTRTTIDQAPNEVLQFTCNKTDMPPLHLYMLCLTHNGPLHHHLRLNPH